MKSKATQYYTNETLVEDVQRTTFMQTDIRKKKSRHLYWKYKLPIKSKSL